jgi:hypothetical protein
MRAVFGLLSLLMTLAIALWIFMGPGGYFSSAQGVLKQGQRARQQAAVIAGKTPDGARHSTDTIDFVTQTNADGSTRGILIRAVESGGAMEQRFGLSPGDLIVEIGPLPVRELVSSEGDAMAWLYDAYQRGQTMVVIRKGDRVALEARDMLSPRQNPTVSTPVNPKSGLGSLIPSH